MYVGDAEAFVLGVTGRTSLRSALVWIAEGRSLRRPHSNQELLDALASLTKVSNNSEIADLAEQALREGCRTLLSSEADPSTQLLDLDLVDRPNVYQKALAELVSHTPDHTMRTVSPAAIYAAQERNDKVITALCAVAGLTFNELRDRSETKLPGIPTRSWNPDQCEAAFRVLTDAITGPAHVAGERESRRLPAEFLLRTPEEPAGWDGVQRLWSQNVPYEILLAQRAVGSAWGQHRNATSQKVQRDVVNDLEARLVARSIVFTRIGRSQKSQEILKRIGVAPDAGETAPGGGKRRASQSSGKITIVAETPAGPWAIAVSVATDGGTANKSGAALGRIREGAPGLRIAVVLVGPGWAERGESTALAKKFDGYLYTEARLDELVDELAGSSGEMPGSVGGLGQTQPSVEQ